MNPKNLLMCAAVVLALLGACARESQPPPLGAAESEIRNGHDSADPVTGMLFRSQVGVDGNTYGQATCTGTLICPNLVLTANHCIASATPPNRFSTWVGPTSAADGTLLVHPDDGTAWVSTQSRTEDYPGLGVDGLTILRFASADRYPDNQGYPYVGWEFPAYDDSWRQLPVGQPLRIVGYGRLTDAIRTGRQRSGTPVYSEITGTPPTIRMTGDEEVCRGDSGGPLFMDHNPIKLIGTALATVGGPCTTATSSWHIATINPDNFDWLVEKMRTLCVWTASSGVSVAKRTGDGSEDPGYATITATDGQTVCDDPAQCGRDVPSDTDVTLTARNGCYFPNTAGPWPRPTPRYRWFDCPCNERSPDGTGDTCTVHVTGKVGYTCFVACND